MSATDNGMAIAQSPPTHYKTVPVNGVEMFYREAGAEDAPVVVLLHGFPTSSRMYRNLIPYLAGSYRVIAPDYPGFGHTARPERGTEFTYNFDNVADLVEALLGQLGVGRFTPYMMDFGGSIGWRLVVRQPEAIDALVLQNAPLYKHAGSFWEDLLPYWADGSQEHRDRARSYLTLESTRDQYLHGVADPSLIDPDTWTIDQAGLDRPGVDEIMLDYLYDISLQEEVFGKAKEFLRSHRPPTLIATGLNDELFPEESMRRFLDDLPDAEFHGLDSGHFALEDKGHEIGTLMRDFLDRKVATSAEAGR